MKLRTITMKKLSSSRLAALTLLIVTSSWSGAWAQDAGEWITVFDGSDLNGFILTGDANWHTVGDVVEVTEGKRLPGRQRTLRGLRPDAGFLGFEQRQQRRVHSLPRSGGARRTDLL